MELTISEKMVLIGRNIAHYRKACCLTQKELAQKVGITSNFLSQIEHGRKSMSTMLFLLIEETLGVQPNALLMYGPLPSDKNSQA